MRYSSRRAGLRVSAAAVASGALAAGALALAAPAGASPVGPAHAAVPAHATITASPVPYSFTTLNNQADPTFNQLLGINSQGVISGYFGAGTPGHPNKGYLLQPPYGQANYTNENFPGSAQTQVTGLNNKGDTSGFWVTAKGTNRGFVEWNGVFASYTDPKTPKVTGAVNQLLGINNAGTAVGFYVDAKGHSHAYEVSQATSKFTAINVPGATSTTAAGINNAGDVTGFYSVGSGSSAVTSSFLYTHTHHLITFQFPGGSDTQAFGINGSDQIVGSYLDGGGVMHGFLLSKPTGPKSVWQRIDDPGGVGSTVVNGLNANGDLVGFYTDAAGNTDGFLAVPNVKTTKNVTLTAMPSGTVRLGRDSGGNITATFNAFGFTPGSQHAVVLQVPGTETLIPLGTFTANGVGQVNDVTVDSTYSGAFPTNGSLGVYNGTGTGAVQMEFIAKAGPLTGTGKTFKLISVSEDSKGHSYGVPQGKATIVYSPSAHTLTVTVQATGLQPGLHAAHIHSGSCQSQGPVVYMIPDFRAALNGKVNQTRVVTGVTGPIPPGGWYLNLHMGNSNQILSGGQPTIYFRPMLCSNIYN
ncbi:MAG TPA: CHRD domain-containing protein [Streptosporangiaceae bacterium]|jgi:hypothetical protein|nr:CHRD domain-containing protein [Streptosporangiaceae bacterium]